MSLANYEYRVRFYSYRFRGNSHLLARIRSLLTTHYRFYLDFRLPQTCTLRFRNSLSSLRGFRSLDILDSILLSRSLKI